MKKFVIAFLCLLLVGCGNTSAEEPAAKEENTAEILEEEATDSSADDADIQADTPAPEDGEHELESGVDLSSVLDITGCDTFTQIVDRVLEPGMGYTNEPVGDTDALIVCSGAYDNLDGNMAAIDSTFYVYGDDGPMCLGAVYSVGTAYPIAINDGIIYVGIWHGTAAYTIKNNELVELEAAWVEYDTDGNETYYYSQNGGEAEEVDNTEKLDEIDEKYYSGKILNFDVIQ